MLNIHQVARREIDVGFMVADYVDPDAGMMNYRGGAVTGFEVHVFGVKRAAYHQLRTPARANQCGTHQSAANGRQRAVSAKRFFNSVKRGASAD